MAKEVSGTALSNIAPDNLALQLLQQLIVPENVRERSTSDPSNMVIDGVLVDGNGNPLDPLKKLEDVEAQIRRLESLKAELATQAETAPAEPLPV